MLINKDTAISTSKILLVPYEPHHVPTYYSWMEDEEIRAATASEALSMDEEYAMQRTWRNDADKLTFIACLPLPPSISFTSPTPTSSPTSSSLSSPRHRSLHARPSQVLAENHDGRSNMIGDINLFLAPAVSDKDANEARGRSYVGELGLMIAPPSARHRGYGRATLVAFLTYLQCHVEDVLREYQTRQVPKKPPGKGDEKYSSDNNKNTQELLMTQNGNNDADPSNMKEGKYSTESRGQSGEKSTLQLKVKIAASNKWSIHLFRSAGFLPSGDGVEDYFGQVELVFDGLSGRGEGGGRGMEVFMLNGGAGTYEEFEYWRD